MPVRPSGIKVSCGRDFWIAEFWTQKRRFGLLRKRLILNGAPSRSRTGTSFRTTDFKSGVSTNFTIRAVVRISPHTRERRRGRKLTRAGNIYTQRSSGKFKAHVFQSVTADLPLTSASPERRQRADAHPLPLDAGAYARSQQSVAMIHFAPRPASAVISLRLRRFSLATQTEQDRRKTVQPR